MSVNFLNLDEMAPARRSVTFGGKTYPVKDMTVEHFIEMNKLANDLEGKTETPADAVNATIRSVTLSLEGCEEADVRKLNIEQLAVLARFIRNEMSPTGEPVESSEGNAEAQPIQG